jgi:hypothetical protein
VIDKHPIRSKKFLAYIISELTTKFLMGYLITHIGTLDIYETTLLLGMVVSSSCLTIGYVLGQAALDKYISAAVEIFDEEDVKKEK